MGSVSGCDAGGLLVVACCSPLWADIADRVVINFTIGVNLEQEYFNRGLHTKCIILTIIKIVKEEIGIISNIRMNSSILTPHENA